MYKQNQNYIKILTMILKVDGEKICWRILTLNCFALQFCTKYSIEFLPMRFWIGFWVMVITFVVIGLEGSFLVKHITRFTEEIFTIVISLIFIYEVVKKMKAVSISVFLPASPKAKAGLGVQSLRPSVRPSVCPSVRPKILSSQLL